MTAKKSKSRDLGTIAASLAAIFAFLSSVVKVASFFFDPDERKRKRRQDAINSNDHDIQEVENSIDSNNEDELNDTLNKISGRRKKTDLLKKDIKGKKKCKKSLRYTRYCQ
jgi:hypothetical protein